MEQQQIDIKKIAEELVKELEIEMAKASDSAKLADGARQGVILLFNKIMEAAQPKAEEHSDVNGEQLQ